MPTILQPNQMVKKQKTDKTEQPIIIVTQTKETNCPVYTFNSQEK